MIETLVQWLKLIDDGDVRDLVDLVKSLNSVLYELSKVNCRLNCVRNTLDNNGVISSLIEKLPSSLEVSADTDSSSDSNLVSWEGILWFVDSSISFGHNFLVSVFDEVKN